jgi:predicted dehydrogenase
MIIRAVIVGLGWRGKNLINAVRRQDALNRFTTAHMRHPETVADFCREHRLRWAGDFDALLAGPTLDTVVRATPHSAHAAQVIRAAAAGKSVSTEGPSPSASSTHAPRSQRPSAPASSPLRASTGASIRRW